MAEKYTFINLIDNVLKQSEFALTPYEIWKFAKEKGLSDKFGSAGKTPWNTISARLYTDLKEKGEDSIYKQVSRYPARFCLKSNPLPIPDNNEKQNDKYQERELHPLLVKYVSANPHFKCYVKTIYHENSSKEGKGKNEWLHPDLVGVYFPFEDYKKETLELQKSMNINNIKLFSFEMKVSLEDYSNLRKYYFQAVSNSSWANEGYLVALNINEDEDFRKELNRLSNAFGIGIIQLNDENIYESEIIYPARVNDTIDWNTLDRLVEVSGDFKDFISNIKNGITLSKVVNKYDKVLNDEEFEKYLRDKEIKK